MSLGTHLADLTLRLGNDDAPGVVAELAAICEPPGVTVEALRRHHLVGLVVRAIADAGSRTMLPNFLLNVLGDRMEMAHSIEGRVPFLDHKVVELVRDMPVSITYTASRGSPHDTAMGTVTSASTTASNRC